MHSYLKSFTPVCIAIIIIYVIKIIVSVCFGLILKEDKRGYLNEIYLYFCDIPGRILFFIPSLIWVIKLIARISDKKCELFMKYYELWSPIYGNDFKNNFSSIMNIKIYTFLIFIFFIAEIAYHAIIFRYILAQD